MRVKSEMDRSVLLYAAPTSVRFLLVGSSPAPTELAATLDFAPTLGKYSPIVAHPRGENRSQGFY